MIESPAFAAMLAMMATAVALMMPARPARILLWFGALLLVGAWLPIVVASMLNASGEYVANGVGLGLLAVSGSTLGLMLAVAGVLWQLTIEILKQAS
jgi:hypothetical protein